MRTFRARWDRFGLLKDTTVEREPFSELGRAAVDDFRVLGAREMRTGISGLYFLARIVLVVPVAIIFVIEWIVATVWRGVAAVVSRVRGG